ncbi:MAG: class I SAM-dependent methyltransferase [Thermoleophilia bacterium]|nr:class I SAM-dependent methyltransferase [Thermoleophilia bacterium]
MEQQDLLLALLTESQIDDGAVLDLGTGSGLVAEAVLEALPGTELVGVDFSPAMLKLAGRRLRRFGSRVHLCQGDLSRPEEIDLPLRRYKAVFSVQTLHHLDNREKAAAFAWMAGLLGARGLVVVIDRVKVEEALFEDWLVTWRRVDPAASGTYAEHVAELTEAGDRPATLDDQIEWMKAAGLATSCLHLYGNRAMLVGRKSE